MIFSLLFLAAAAAGSLVEHERAAAPDGWQLIRRVAADELLSLRVAVKEKRNLDAADVVARSDPQSVLYGQYLSAAGLKEYLAAATPEDHSASWDRVRAWLVEHGVAIVQETASGFDISLPAAQAESLLDTHFSVYSNDNDDEVARTEVYSLPSSLRADIDYIFPTIHFFGTGSRPRGLDRRQASLPKPPFDCSQYICPINVTELYSIDYVPDKPSKSKLAIGGFLENYSSSKDWDKFFELFGDGPKPAPYTVETVNGGKNPDTIAEAGVEAMLDLEYSTAFTGSLNVTYYSVGGRPPTLVQPGNKPDNDSQNEPYLEFIDYLLALDDIPQVLAMSYTDDEQTVPYNYAVKVCDRFGQLALRGVSVIVASGDGAAMGTRISDCLGPDGELRFIPTFPASCPWVTTIGATSQWGGVAAFSSGGFSNYFARPSWQDGVVDTYVKSLEGNNITKWFNASGRAFPDLTLRGKDYLVRYANVSLPSKGTSASTPVFGAMIASINDLRLSKGLPVLGFLNARLYSSNLTSAYQDVDKGEINGCADGDDTQTGFEAVAGWDAATGWGEPHFPKLRQLLTEADDIASSGDTGSAGLSLEALLKAVV